MRRLTYTVTYGDRPADARSVADRLRAIAVYVGTRSCPVHDMPPRPKSPKPGPEADRWGPGTDPFLRLDGGREDVTFEHIPNVARDHEGPDEESSG